MPFKQRFIILVYLLLSICCYNTCAVELDPRNERRVEPSPARTDTQHEDVAFIGLHTSSLYARDPLPHLAQQSTPPWHPQDGPSVVQIYRYTDELNHNTNNMRKTSKQIKSPGARRRRSQEHLLDYAKLWLHPDRQAKESAAAKGLRVEMKKSVASLEAAGEYSQAKILKGAVQQYLRQYGRRTGMFKSLLKEQQAMNGEQQGPKFSARDFRGRILARTDSPPTFSVLNSVMQRYHDGDIWKTMTDLSKKRSKLKRSQNPQDQIRYARLLRYSEAMVRPNTMKTQMAQARREREESKDIAANLNKAHRTYEATLLQNSSKHLTSHFGRYVAFQKALNSPNEYNERKSGRKSSLRSRSVIDPSPVPHIMARQVASDVILRRQFTGAPPIKFPPALALAEVHLPGADDSMLEESMVQSYHFGDSFKQRTNDDKKITRLKNSHKVEDQERYGALVDTSKHLTSPTISNIALARAKEVKAKSNKLVSSLRKNNRAHEAKLWQGSTKYQLSEFGRWYGFHKALAKQTTSSKQTRVASQSQRGLGSTNNPRDV